MKSINRVTGAAFLVVAALAVPSAALAADDEFTVTALVERDTAGKPVPHEIHPGESAPVTLGVGNLSDTAVKGGVVVNIRVLNDLDLPREWNNCWYYTDSNLDGAWCEIPQDLEPTGRYQLARFKVALAAKVTEKPGAIIFRWFPQSYADTNGGVEALAVKDSDKKAPPVAGTDNILLLESRDLPWPAEPNAIGFAAVKVVTPSTPPTTPTSPSAPNPPPASASAPAEAAGTGGGGSDDGGLPLTGANTATILGAGVLLLLAGGLAAVLARRRRTRFTA